MHVRNFQHPNLIVEEFNSSDGESWCIFGSNSSGVEQFLALLQGDLGDSTVEKLDIPHPPTVISFAKQQEFFEQEVRNDDTDFIGTPDPGTLVREFLPDYQTHLPLFDALAMTHCLNLGYRQLSSGQCRKLLLLKTLIEGGKLLVLQNPYDGLDEKSCFELDQAMTLLTKQDRVIFVFVNITADIPNWCSHLAVIEHNRVKKQGKREEVLPFCNQFNPDSTCLPDNEFALQQIKNRPQDEKSSELVALNNGFAQYGEKLIFTGLSFTISTGDHTLVCGPNGCGKSTLLDIITGDNPNCYGNDLRIFGNKRGSGESIWDLKKEMGMISPSLHRDHRLVGTALHVVLSGLFDSIGLYRQPHSQDINKAMQWLHWIGLSQKKKVFFSRLSFAEQRLVLIARALVKKPRLLILDEPTQGLDNSNRKQLLLLLERVADSRLSTIVYVSHRKDEHKEFFRQKINLDTYAAE